MGLTSSRMRYFKQASSGLDKIPMALYAVKAIPKFIEILRKGESPRIFGDGLQSRDFTFVDNAVFANLAAMAKKERVGFACVNIACGDRD